MKATASADVRQHRRHMQLHVKQLLLLDIADHLLMAESHLDSSAPAGATYLHSTSRQD